MRDYEQWHQQYDDPGSPLSWRLQRVRDAIGAALDSRDGPVRVLSVCSGDGRDVLGVLARRADSARVSGALLEVHPAIAERARAAASAFPRIEVRTADAGDSDSYRGAVPADLVLLVGVLGNLSADDVDRTVAAAPQLCAAGATLLWTRGVSAERDNNGIRRAFGAAGFEEVDYREYDGGDERPALGVVRFTGAPPALEAGRRLFTFVR